MAHSPNGPIITVWVTKYALTKGILEFQARVSGVDPKGRMISVEGKFTDCYHKPFWYDNEADAKQHAENQRVKKIKALEQQIDKLNTLKF